MVTQAKAQAIKDLLDRRLSHEKLQTYGDVDEEAARLFKQIYAEQLGFDAQPGVLGDPIPTDNWRSDALAKDAYLLAQDYDSNVRVIYVIIEKMTRSAQRFSISSLITHGWAQRGNTIVIFHSPDSEVWHLVTAFDNEESGRLVLQRFVAGVGENHRTLAKNLSYMDVELDQPLYDRVREAFSVQVITKDFYDKYRERFQQLKIELSHHVEAREAKEYAHLLLNRLMFLYFLQKKRWLSDRKDFMRWFLERYQQSDDEESFHSKWLTTLFFNAMSEPQHEKHLTDEFPADVENALNSFPHFNGGLFERHAVDDKVESQTATISDAVMQDIISNFLEGYNFTVTEESPFDVDMAVDPAMLGKIYESLIAEEERGKDGIFYTPRVEVDLMCRLGLLEYLTSEDEESTDSAEFSKDEIIEFLFTPLESWDKDQSDRYLDLKPFLDQVTVCDPACGSGAFLVGMLQVLSELYSKLGVSVDYTLKEDIIQRSIHGADIKDWAIRMAEFRLWLALIESESELPSDEPVLPNFTFNLRCGDSIVQKLGDEHVRLDLRPKHVNSEIQNEITEFQNLQRRHYLGESIAEDTIRQQQVVVLKKLIDQKIEGLKTTRHGIQQRLDGQDSEESRSRHDTLTEQIKQLEQQKSLLDKSAYNRSFIWGLDFLGPMIQGGFDVVIANPPYVRHQDIVDPKLEPEDVEKMSKQEIKARRSQYKDDLKSYVQTVWSRKLPKSCDIYVHFFFRGLELTKKRGSLVYISTNAWLDVDYGKHLQSLLLTHSRVHNIIDNSLQRSFKEADVNTIITVSTKKEEPKKLYGSVSFLNFIAPFSSVHSNNIMSNAMDTTSDISVKYRGEQLSIKNSGHCRRVVVDEPALWKLGNAQIIGGDNQHLAHGNYEGDNWGGKYLRAPYIFYTILSRGGDRLIQLPRLASIGSYLNTGGADGFFFVDLVEEGGEYCKIRNRKHDEIFTIESESIAQFLESPSQITGVELKGNEELSHIVVSSGEKLNLLSKYIEWGKQHGFNKTKMASSNYEGGLLLWPCRQNDRFYVIYNPDRILSHRFYKLSPYENVDPRLLLGLLNSTLTALMTEIMAPTSLGQGVLDVTGVVLKRILLPRLEKLTQSQVEQIKEGTESLCSRSIGTIFEELGLPVPEDNLNNIDPEKIELEQITGDRRRIDSAVFDSLQLSDSEQIEVYKAVVRMVKRRLVKARSV